MLVAARYGEKITENPFPNPDVNRDGIVDIRDIILIIEDMSEVHQGAPSLLSNIFQYQQAYNTLSIDVVNKGIATLNRLFCIHAPIKTLLFK